MSCRRWQQVGSRAHPACLHAGRPTSGQGASADLGGEVSQHSRHRRLSHAPHRCSQPAPPALHTPLACPRRVVLLCRGGLLNVARAARLLFFGSSTAPPPPPPVSGGWGSGGGGGGGLASPCGISPLLPGGASRELIPHVYFKCAAAPTFCCPPATAAALSCPAATVTKSPGQRWMHFQAGAVMFQPLSGQSYAQCIQSERVAGGGAGGGAGGWAAGGLGEGGLRVGGLRVGGLGRCSG